MDYQDFEIEIRSTAGGYQVRVLDSPWGRVAEPFTAPFEPAELETHLRALQRRLPGDRRTAASRDLDGGARPRCPERSSMSPERLGEELARHLFPGRVGNYLYGCLGRMEGLRTGGRELGLRLRVCFDREDRFAPLAALPWELLHPDDRLSFLGRDRWTPVVRYLETGHADPRRLDAELRVLLVDSTPVDQEKLDTEEERRHIRGALETLEGTEVEVYQHPSVEGLRTRLLEREFHVLHFLGHGGFDPHSGEGRLYFETPDRLAAPVSGPLLGVHLQGIPSLRLVVLNACWSGAFPRHEGGNPFSGVAAELTRKGLPAVVAMQHPITDGAAITFSRKLYQRLAAFDPVDAAITEARLAVHAADPAGYEWATPVLFLGVEDGHLFKPLGDEALSPPTRGGGEEEPVRLEIRTFGERGHADELLDLRPLFDGLRPRDPRVWQEALAPRLQGFLDTCDEPLRPLELHLAAPPGVAFLLGHLLTSRSPLDLTVVEENPVGEVRRVRVAPGPSQLGEPWRQEGSREIDEGGRDLALAVDLGRSRVGVVERFLTSRDPAGTDDGDEPRRSAGRLLVLVAPAGGKDPHAQEEGRRLLELAQGLVPVVQQERTAEERRGSLHLFADVPPVFLLFLGQLAADLGRVQLYEPGDGTWRPTLRFPLRNADDP